MRSAWLLLALMMPMALACPDESTFRLQLKKGLFDYLQSPEQAALSIEELKDILIFYLTEDVSVHDCSAVSGAESGAVIGQILAKAERIPSTVVDKCSDGTMYGECAAVRPRFCYSGMLMDLCAGPDSILGNDDDCGCPELMVCQTDGSCRTEPIACFADEDCGPDTLVSTYCSESSVYGIYVRFICTEPGTPQSGCTYQNESLLIETCSTACIAGSCV